MEAAVAVEAAEVAAAVTTAAVEAAAAEVVAAAEAAAEAVVAAVVEVAEVAAADPARTLRTSRMPLRPVEATRPSAGQGETASRPYAIRSPGGVSGVKENSLLTPETVFAAFPML
ncbi:hypothetical protein ABZ470_16435 [Streptosporangium sp. NPDC020072]|uniref:hypothetical protein n=1 Tax=Streptosporangium sp. NPDC020072 TaxID=3154788 RepID=UPI003439707F